MPERWTWSCTPEPPSSGSVDGVESTFPTQADAEAWLGESWQDLAEAGVAEVSLNRDGELVYGPMSLAPAD